MNIATNQLKFRGAIIEGEKSNISILRLVPVRILARV